ncbi:MAG: hypothetical protein VR73_05495 [Gammaproteobacteria bacterium BRH_c0]|nr:MAG: hypothetical protein VR73_05495 [Gammaproteobacteria bacterium BRH_c0]
MCILKELLNALDHDIDIQPEIDEISGADDHPHFLFESTEDQSGANATNSFELLDTSHTVVGQCVYTPGAEIVSNPVEHSSPRYMQLGEGNTVFVATSIADAIALHKTGISAKTIAPLHAEDLIDICASLKNSYPSHQYVVLGSRSHSHLIVAAKELISAKSDYPPPRFDSWYEFEDKEGVEAVDTYLHRFDSEAAAVDSFLVTDEHVKNIENQRFLFDNLIINQHIAVICAEPNAGKTTIMNWVCSQISETTDIRYLNLDCSGSELRDYQSFAKQYGFEFINFDITETKEEDFFQALRDSPDLSGKLYIFDTMKKLVDPMRKDQVKAFMKLLRTFCVKGASFVLLAHTNKHKTKEGLPVFEGVGDVRADCDEMIYLIPQDNADGSKTVTTAPDKTRGHFVPITFTISEDRSVSLTEYVDLLEESRQRADQSIISTVLGAISAGQTTQGAILEACQQQGISTRQSRRVLEAYSKGAKHLWTVQRGKNNSLVYTPA